MPKQRGCHTIANAVNIDDFSCFRQRIGGSQVYVCLHSCLSCHILILFPVPINGIMAGKHIIQSHHIQCSRTAKANTDAINFSIEIVCRFFCCCKFFDSISTSFQIFCYLPKISHYDSSSFFSSSCNTTGIRDAAILPFPLVFT